jgi:acylphosphatase
MTADRIARRVVVSGDVQGVFFRDSTRREARAAGVTGWVRNRSDGRVEAVFEGSPEAVARLVRWCADGPRDASVDDVQVSEAQREGHERFVVR